MPDNLERKAREFAKELARLLNTTVADGVTLSAVQVQRGDDTLYAIGHGLSKSNPHRPGLIPLTIDRSEASLYLYAFHVMKLDELDGKSLTDWKANYAVQIGKSADTGTLFAYDYARDVANPYPRAHFHIYADLGTHYERALEGTGRDKLRDLHFPVGGFSEPDGSVRYRPILEDIIEMLILEKMVDHREDWEAAVKRGRKRFFDLQYRSAQLRRGC